MCTFHFTQDKIVTNLVLSNGTCHAEKVAAQMSKSCRPKGRWVALTDNLLHIKLSV